MYYNLHVVSFAVTGKTTFTVSNSGGLGVFVEGGSASGPQILNRINVLPSGALHDMDGTDQAVTILPKVWNEFVFVSASPQHSQYNNLINLIGYQGTLTVKVPGPSSTTQYTATARLLALPEDSQWQSPYAQGTRNWLMIRATWQLKTAPA